VRELLEGLGLRHTLAVFLPEANLLKPASQSQQQSSGVVSAASQCTVSRASIPIRPSTQLDPMDAALKQEEHGQRRAELRGVLGMAASPSSSSSSSEAPLIVEVRGRLSLLTCSLARSSRRSRAHSQKHTQLIKMARNSQSASVGLSGMGAGVAAEAEAGEEEEADGEEGGAMAAALYE